MTEIPAKAPKKVKEKRQTPQERLEAMRYNHMMYGPTEGELKMTPKKVDYGASFLKHPKFQSLMAAFKNGTSFKFDITADGHVISIDTDGSHISFGDKVLCYSRPLNKHEDNLILDRTSLIQLQTKDPVIHLIFAVLRSFPELDGPELQYQHHRLYLGNDALESSYVEQSSNPLMGAYKHNKVHERIRK
jgi:hypothetical protein